MSGPVPDVVVEATGTIDDGDSAYPQVVQLDDGDLLCSYSNSGGSLATGGTDWARSSDGGRTWRTEGTILAPGSNPPSSNFLKLSRPPDTDLVYAYGARLSRVAEPRFGDRRAEAVLCRSEDRGRTWTEPTILAMPSAGLEISSPLIALEGGRLLAPAATVAAGRMGEEVLVARSRDSGRTWHDHVRVAGDAHGVEGYLEHKFSQLPGGRLLATFWTVRMSDMADLPNSFAISDDLGTTWSAARPTDVHGQTMSTLPLDDGHLLVLYNRRTGAPGIISATVRSDGHSWTTIAERPIYLADASRTTVDSDAVGMMNAFQFGFPTMVRVSDGSILATYWSVESGRTGVRWARLRIAS